MLVGSNSWPDVTWKVAESWDNSGSVMVTSTHKRGTQFPAGSTTVFYTATDPYGNNATCSFSVTLTGKLIRQFNALES